MCVFNLLKIYYETKINHKIVVKYVKSFKDAIWILPDTCTVFRQNALDCVPSIATTAQTLIRTHHMKWMLRIGFLSLLPNGILDGLHDNRSPLSYSQGNKMWSPVGEVSTRPNASSEDGNAEKSKIYL